MSFPRKRESTAQDDGNAPPTGWIPAFAGMTALGISRVFQMTPLSPRSELTGTPTSSRRSRRPFHASELLSEQILAHGLHHLPRLIKLPEQLIDLLDAGAAPTGDAFAPPAVDNFVVVALLGSHGVDDGLDVDKFFLIHFHLSRVLEDPDFRQHPQHLVHRAERAHLPKLIAEVLERESIALDLAVHLQGLLFVDFFLRLLDQRKDVAHAENAGD